MSRLEPDLFFSANDRQFLLESLFAQDSLRLDGRHLFEMRNLEIILSNNAAEVCLGETRVFTQVSCDVVAPKLDRPTEGFLTFHIDFSPMASEYFEQISRWTSRASQAAIEMSRMIERCFKESHAIDTEALCLIAGKKVWNVHVEMKILDANGNVNDCTQICALIALLHFRRPDATVFNNAITIHALTERAAIPLPIHHLPISLTFASFLYDKRDRIVLDPTLREEQCSDSYLTVVCNNYGEICALQKSGGRAIDGATLDECLDVATAKVKELTDMIQERLKSQSAPVNQVELPPLSQFTVIDSV